jgi:viroplasmin and RNaseH domain-containing protein
LTSSNKKDDRVKCLQLNHSTPNQLNSKNPLISFFKTKSEQTRDSLFESALSNLENKQLKRVSNNHHQSNNFQLDSAIFNKKYSMNVQKQNQAIQFSIISKLPFKDLQKDFNVVQEKIDCVEFSDDNNSVDNFCSAQVKSCSKKFKFSSKNKSSHSGNTPVLYKKSLFNRQEIRKEVEEHSSDNLNQNLKVLPTNWKLSKLGQKLLQLKLKRLN